MVGAGLGSRGASEGCFSQATSRKLLFMAHGSVIPGQSVFVGGLVGFSPGEEFGVVEC